MAYMRKFVLRHKYAGHGLYNPWYSTTSFHLTASGIQTPLLVTQGAWASNIMEPICLTRPHTSRGWFDVPDDIQERILGSLSLIYLSVFSLTSRVILSLVRRHARDRLHRFLEDFDLPIDLFKDIMRKYMAIISGSAALLIIEPLAFEPGDLDVYVPRGSFDAVHQFLVTKTDYTPLVLDDEEENLSPLESLSSRLRDYSRGIAKTGVVKIRYYLNRSSGKTINIMETQLKTPTSAMFMFHSTFVMNYITWNTIVCPYPILMANHVGLLNSCRLELSDVVVACLEKYKGRGFSVLNNWAECKEEHACGQDPCCGETFRRIDDNGTMRLFYDENSSDAMDVIDDGLRWKLATRVDCSIPEDQEDGYEYNPNSGLVVTSSNCTLVKVASSLS